MTWKTACAGSLNVAAVPTTARIVSAARTLMAAVNEKQDAEGQIQQAEHVLRDDPAAVSPAGLVHQDPVGVDGEGTSAGRQRGHFVMQRRQRRAQRRHQTKEQPAHAGEEIHGECDRDEALRSQEWDVFCLRLLVLVSRRHRYRFRSNVATWGRTAGPTVLSPPTFT
jgi:hypothetical protein